MSLRILYKHQNLNTCIEVMFVNEFCPEAVTLSNKDDNYMGLFGGGFLTCVYYTERYF